MKILPLLMVCIGICRAESLQLSGELKGHIAKGEYTAVSSLIIGKGEEVVIDSATTIHFKQFTALKIFGKATIKGTKNKPVLFTSDESGWNGIEYDNDSLKTSMEHVKIANAVIGLNVKAKDPQLALDSIEFINTGYMSCVREGKPLAIIADKPYSMEWGSTRIANVNEVKEEPSTTVKIKEGKQNNGHSLKIGFAIAGGCLTLAGASMAIAEAINCSKLVKQYNEATTPQGTEESKSKYNTSQRVKDIGIGVLAAGLLSFGVAIIIK